MNNCRTCIAPVTKVSTTGQCHLCDVFIQCMDEGVIRNEAARFRREAIDDGASVVEFSGGRHSTIALALARQRLGLEVVAITISNGFLPSAVVKQAQQVCASLGARHFVVEVGFDSDAIVEGERPKMARACELCNRHISSAVLTIAQDLGLRWAANGENKYRSLEPSVSSVGRVSTVTGRTVNTINLPFAMGITRSDGEDILRKIGWQEVSVPGMSSNCLIPWLSTEGRHAAEPGNPLFELVAAEVRCGYLTREQGFEAIRETQSATTDQVAAQLSEARRWAATRPTPRVAYDSLDQS